MASQTETRESRLAMPMRGDSEHPAGDNVSETGSASQLLAMRRALLNARIAVLCQDSDQIYRWCENVPSVFTQTTLIGLTDADIFSPADAERLAAAKREVMRTGSTHRLEIEMPDPAGLWYELSIDRDETTGGLITTIVDVSEHKRREQTLRTLLREVSHRSKNLLAIIQSIATQTSRYSGTMDEFLNRFRGRLQSLSSSQDLVTSSNWRGADLGELVQGQVGRYCADPSRNLSISGEMPYLNPNAALHVGLALHELAVNSVSFGALSSPEGVVEIAVEQAGPEWPAALRLTWHEKVPAGRLLAFRERRFGSVALERVVPASLNSRGTLETSGDSLTYTLILPHDSYLVR